MPPHGNLRFDETRRERFLELLRTGHMKRTAARTVGVHYRTIERRRQHDPDFKWDMDNSTREAAEPVEKMVYDLALQGDLRAAEMWTKAYASSNWRQLQRVEIDATPAAVELSRNQLDTRLAELQATLTERRLNLAADDDSSVIDVGGTPVTDAVAEQLELDRAVSLDEARKRFDE